jgi:ComF family protein
MLELIFPRICLGCKSNLEKNKKLFCQACSKSFELIDYKLRCSKCFLDLGCGCKKRDNPFEAMAAALEYNMQTQRLIYKLKYAKAFYLSKSAASFMLLQFLALKWPMPDLVTSIPMTFSRFLQRGFNQSALIATYFAKMINRPYKKLLIKKGYTPQQASLNLEGRRLSDQKFLLKDKYLDLTNQKVLIIDDVITTGNTIKRAGLALKSANCDSLYALALCRTNNEQISSYSR